MDIVAAKQIAMRTMMDCLGYVGHVKTPMFSARVGVAGPPVVFLGSVSGDGIGDYLESAETYLNARGLSRRETAECKRRALAVIDILSAD